MEKRTKRTSLGIQKNNKKSTKQIRRTFLKNLVDFLRADSYLFGPLISPSHSEFGALKFSPSSTRRLKIKEPVTGTKKKFIGEVKRYLKSDDYMYASLVSRQTQIDPTTSVECKLQYIRSVTMDISTRDLTTEKIQPTIQSTNVIGKNQPFKDSFGGTSDPSNQTPGHGETVRHMVYQNCHSSSVSGKQIMDQQIGELIIEWS